ncbi:hypothetical protein [Atopobium fossor]|uniref:hypothetical protein n=1 Tax=Atopobium fossor TaxID=39487 RepID=UPI0004057125|nr:hypothetical protein [Atopobium fossor]
MSSIRSIFKKLFIGMAALVIVLLSCFVIERVYVAFLYAQGPSEELALEEARNSFRFSDSFSLVYVDRDQNGDTRYRFIGKDKDGVIRDRLYITCKFQWFTIISPGEVFCPQESGMRIPFMPPTLFDIIPAGWYYYSTESTPSVMDRFLISVRGAPNQVEVYKEFTYKLSTKRGQKLKKLRDAILLKPLSTSISVGRTYKYCEEIEKAKFKRPIKFVCSWSEAACYAD